MPTTTVIDTIHHVVYDTVHTSIFDTVHSVSYDTVKVVLDSQFTVQVLRDSQTFYQDSFNNLLMLVSVAIAFASAILTLLSFAKSNYDSKKLRKDFDSRSSEVAKEESAKIALEAKNEFNEALKEQKKHIEEAKKNSQKLWNETIPIVVNSAKRTDDDAIAISDLCSIIKMLSGDLDEDQATLVMKEILPELDRRLRTLEFSNGFDNFIIEVQEILNFFKPKLSTKMNEAKKNVVEKMIDEMISITKSRLNDFFNIKNDKYSNRTGRFYTDQRNRLDTKRRKR